MQDSDFTGRTVMKIITSCSLEQLLSESDPKVESLMNTIFMGNEAQMCDGTVTDFSTMLNMLFSEAKKDKNANFLSIITMQFKHVLDKDYFFQHRYRSRCIYFYFLKEMFSASILLGLNMIVYMDFLWKFQGNLSYNIQPDTIWPNANLTNATSE